MSKSTSFEGVLSGDCECFCWEVTKETYIAMFGQEYYDDEIELEKRVHELDAPLMDVVTEFDESKVKLRVYPTDIFSLILGEKSWKLSDKPMKFTVSIE